MKMVKMDINQKDIMKAASAKLIRLAEEEIFPFLEDRIRIETEQMTAKFLEGKPCENHVAMISAFIILKNQLTLKLRQGERISAKIQNPN